MNKKILIGSMLVLTLLLLMPSIPAIQQKVIEDKAYNDLEEQMKSFDFEKLKDIIDMVESPKHPLLLFLVILVGLIQGLRGGFYLYMGFVFFTEDHFKWGFVVTNPILFLICGLRGLCIAGTGILWVTIWQIIADMLGWNWPILF